MPCVKYAMDYRPKNSFSMSYALRKVIFPGVCYSVSAAAYLPLCLLCCISAIVFAVVYLPLCIRPCVSAPVNVYLDPVLYIWHCIRRCVSAAVYISATVYPPMYICHCVCCIVESDRVQREIELSIVQK